MLFRSFSDQEQGDNGAAAAQQALGLAVTPMTPTIARQLGVDAATKGVVVTSVDQSTDAAAKGLQRGDIILSANNRSVSNEAELAMAVKSATSANRNAVLLQVQRRGQRPAFVAVRLRDK